MSMQIIEQAKSLESLSVLMIEFLRAKARYLAGIRFGIAPERFTCDSVESGEIYVTVDNQIHIEANLNNDELEFSTLDFSHSFKPKDWQYLAVSLAE